MSLDGRGLDFTLNDITHNVLGSRNSTNLNNRTPKMQQSNKENGTDRRSAGGVSSVEMGRWLEEKERVVVRQKEQIAVLKKFIEDITNNKEYRDQEEEMKRQQQMLRLRQQETSYLHNMRELESLKTTLAKIKKKYEFMLNEKNAVCLRNNALINENQELTLTITNLKQEQRQPQLAQKLLTVEEQVLHSMEELRGEQTRRQGAEQRCAAMQRRMNEWMVKHNEAQDSASQWQIKYYKMQQECDGLRVDGQNWEQQYKNCHKKFEAQKEGHFEQADKLKQKADRLQRQLHHKEELLQSMSMASQKHQNSSERVDELTQELNHRQSQVQHLQVLVSSLQQQKKQIKSQIQSNEVKYERQIESLHKLNQELNRQNQEMKNSMDDKAEQSQQIRQKIQTLQVQLTQNNEVVSQQKDKLQSQNQKLLSELVQIQDRLIEKESQVENYKDQNNKFKEQLYSISEKDTATRAELCRVQKVLAESRETQKNYQEKYEHQLREYNQLLVDFKQVENDNAKMLKTNAITILEVNNLKNELILAQTCSNSHPNQDLQMLKSENDQYRQGVQELRAELNGLKGHLNELNNEHAACLHIKDSTISTIRQQVQTQLEQITTLTHNLSLCQQRYFDLQQRHRRDCEAWQDQRQQLVAAREQDRAVLHQSRLSLGHSHNTHQTTLTVLREENSQMQQIFSEQLQKRNSIIRELMGEKKALYEQLGARSQ